MKIAFAPICTCNNNRRIWRHNASTYHSRDVTDELWWRHNANSENDNLWRQWRKERSMIVFCRIMCSGHRIVCEKYNHASVTVNNDFGGTRDAICQWFSLVTSSLVKIVGKSPHLWQNIVIYGNSCIILYILVIITIVTLPDPGLCFNIKTVFPGMGIGDDGPNWP